MDSKKVIAKLIKIANNQQKIIEKLAQLKTPPAQLEPNMGKHLSDEAAVKAKMGPAANRVASLLFSTNNLQGGASFKVQYQTSGQIDPKSAQALEKSIGDAIEAAQADRTLGRRGSFYVEPWHSGGIY
jgi:hypothetical protein